jgi:hypothetical protein
VSPCFKIQSPKVRLDADCAVPPGRGSPTRDTRGGRRRRNK